VPGASNRKPQDRENRNERAVERKFGGFFVSGFNRSGIGEWLTVTTVADFRRTQDGS
jgi:hypothetical protein